VASLNHLETVLELHFQDPSLLQQAFVHRSYLNEVASPQPASNERLEFLGDAVLGLVVADELYTRFPQHTEGRLTEMRALLVRGSTLSKVGERLALGSLLVLGRGEERSGGRARVVNVGRALEALIGAVYLDQGMEVARRVVLRLLEPDLSCVEQQALGREAKSALQELAQASLRVTPEYVTVAQEGPEHAREFVVSVRLGEELAGTGRGRNKRQAQQAAALAALQALSLAGESAPSPPRAIVTDPGTAYQPRAVPPLLGGSP
jgi:ribonuclease III